MRDRTAFDGRIFLLLDDKLADIAKTLGKVDEHGNVAEDLRGQILGQLSERINYQGLYAAALQDPELKRTRLELDAAMSNAAEARDVVFERFQDLDRFSLEDYAPLAGSDDGMTQLAAFLARVAEVEGWTLARLDGDRLRLRMSDQNPGVVFSTQRDVANADDTLSLLGLDHPLIEGLLAGFRSLSPEDLGLIVQSPDGRTGALGLWRIDRIGGQGQTRRTLLRLAIDTDHRRILAWEHQPEDLIFAEPAETDTRPELLDAAEAVVERELRHRGLIRGQQTYAGMLVGWVQVV